MAYAIIVADNYHYMDKDEHYQSAVVESADLVLAACQSIVDSYLESALKDGVSVGGLYQSYKMFGEDPFIVAKDGSAPVHFSAWDYAKEWCELFLNESPFIPNSTKID